ncbi:LOW QUALITY PROTEIN: hypothetical protein ENH_00077760 [Eimeria necatrix]|uniref:Secreted protein n=1 Tax=Eimeria necatrix TaxID=51315 RepID=U6N5W9_9EIME|nr:LOW QUALITY PROTEIN: hypothetical protein ENH_00077760 [Eimeria necatrix]CDJ70075.1 hypothetical protein ENH_00077760 [Eimeria necatrix]
MFFAIVFIDSSCSCTLLAACAAAAHPPTHCCCCCCCCCIALLLLLLLLLRLTSTGGLSAACCRPRGAPRASLGKSSRPDKQPREVPLLAAAAAPTEWRFRRAAPSACRIQEVESGAQFRLAHPRPPKAGSFASQRPKSIQIKQKNAKKTKKSPEKRKIANWNPAAAAATPCSAT